MRNLKFIFLSLFIITMLSSCQKQPTANFTLLKTTAYTNESIIITNTSIDADHYYWSFGDGFSSTNSSPVHSYSTAGTYAITLTAYSKNNKKSDSKTVIITIADPVPVVNATLQVTVKYLDYAGYQEVPGIDVTLYDSYTNWQNKTSAIATETTSSYGIATFTGLNEISYYVYVHGYDQYSNMYSNVSLGNTSQTYIKTSTLSEDITNYFDAIVLEY